MHRNGSSVMFPWGSCNIRPSRPNELVGIDFMPTPISATKLRIFHTKQITAEMALFMDITFKFELNLQN